MSYVTVSLLNLTCLTASQKGLDRSALLKKVGIPEEILTNGENFVPCEWCCKLLIAATKLSKNPNFPLENGQNFQPNNFSVLGQLLSYASDLRTAYENCEQFNRLIGDGLTNSFEEKDGKVYHYMDIAAPELEPYKHYLLESCLSQVITFMRQLVGKDLRPLEVHFQHEQRTELAAYERIFNCKIKFNAPRYALIFPASILKEKIITSNDKLFSLFYEYAENYLAEISNDEKVTRLVSKTILDLMPSNNATLSCVAQKLAIGTRTLQRLLKEEGQTFNNILNRVRRELAQRHLQSNRLSISEISYLLGFAEPSIFHRSFKKWTGMTPTNYRKENIAA